MAELVSAPPPKTRKRKYPYEEWFVGGWMKLTLGEDFTITPISMQNTILSFARRNGIHAQVEIRRDMTLPGKPERFVYVLADSID